MNYNIYYNIIIYFVFFTNPDDLILRLLLLEEKECSKPLIINAFPSPQRRGARGEVLR
jgi:hypothetical protein